VEELDNGFNARYIIVISSSSSTNDICVSAAYEAAKNMTDAVRQKGCGRRLRRLRGT